ncbi:MAG: PHB depolymerase family esterase [Mycobacteriales bacterium]
MRRLPWSRRSVVAGTLLLLVLGVGAVAPLAGALDPVTVGSDDRVVLGDGRAYVLHTPPLLRRTPRLAEGRPAMLVLHGLLSDPADAARSTGFNALADRDGVLVAYPVGVRRSFNAGLCCGEAVAQEVDDVAFLTDVVHDLRSRGAGRISVVGFSNGAMMAYRLACDRPDLIDSVGVMSGTLEIPRCAGRIRALHLHGEKDTAVPYDGAEYSEKLRAFLRPVPTIQDAAPGSDITIRKLIGYGHRWTEPGDAVDATAEFWRFGRLAPGS